MAESLINPVVYVSCDASEARDRAQLIFETLGWEFFNTNPYVMGFTDEQLVKWISDILVRDALRVEFNDVNDAVLFKLTCGGR